MERPRKLSAAFVKTVRTPGRYGDGRGGYSLSLLVKNTTTGRLSKSWAQRLRINGQRFNVGLGSYPRVTLAEAREKALANVRTVDSGTDLRVKEKPIPTFAEAVDSVIAIRSEGWKHPKTVQRWRATLATYAMPVLGDKLVSEVKTSHVMEVLTPIWLAKPETGRQVREHISVIMEWAIAENHRIDNPAGKAITKSLPKQTQRVKHHRALPFAAVGEAIGKVRATDAWPTTKLCLELLTLTAARSGEVRLADWSEIDWGSRTWTIPASRMKNGLEHRVSLSRQAVEVLRQALLQSDGSGLLFPSERGKTLTDSTVSKLLRENDIGCVPHGMRSSFRDWAAECSDVPREIAEHALAHIEGSAAELAYRRTDYFERRRTLMQAWANYVLPE